MPRACPAWEGELGAYIVGALDRAAAEAVARHLAGCAGCRAEHDELIPVRVLLDRLARLAAAATAPGLASSVADAHPRYPG